MWNTLSMTRSPAAMSPAKRRRVVGLELLACLSDAEPSNERLGMTFSR
jgi:hypothetical protein